MRVWVLALLILQHLSSLGLAHLELGRRVLSHGSRVRCCEGVVVVVSSAIPQVSGSGCAEWERVVEIRVKS